MNIPIKNLFSLIAICCFFFLPAKAQTGDSVRVSLLTCSPGEEIYALFGHTAIRYENYTQQTDLVFNYGMFSFQTPHFIWRFVKGETDYQLGITPYSYFETEYALRGSSVYQQTLNLLPEEKDRLIHILFENYQPENRIYRYNFFYDNCTTRARDKIEESLQGILHYKDGVPPHKRTFREIVHQYTKGHDWAEFGIDLCLGSQADEPIDYRTQMFAPFYLLNAFEGARIIRGNGHTATLAMPPREIVKGTERNLAQTDTGFPLTPVQTALLLLSIVTATSTWGLYKQKLYWGIDIPLFGAAGAAGCVIAFLVFFSVHPTVRPNYLLLFLNPVHLFYLPFMIYFSIKGKKDWYHWINLIALTLFIVLWGVLPQKFNLAILPLALCLLIRSASHLIWIYKRKK